MFFLIELIEHFSLQHLIRI